MKPKHIVSLVAVVILALITVAAAGKLDTKAGSRVLRLKSHGDVIAEIRVVAPAKMQMSQYKMEVRGGHTVWRADDSSKTVTARLIVDDERHVEFTAEEIELDHEVNVGSNNK